MEEYWINSIGKTLYSKAIDKYNKNVDGKDNKKSDLLIGLPKEQL